jgi:hypothetical protein
MKKYLLIYFTLLSASTLFAANITVTNKNDSGAGSLRTAITTSVSGDVIVFNASLSNQTITLASTLQIPVGKNLTIDGSGVTGLTISGNNAVRIFLLGSTSVNPTSLTLKNLNLINGLANDNGAAVLTQNQGVLNISNCNFSGNNAADGGSAIYSDFEASSTILNCTFSNNVCITGNNESGSTVFLFGPNVQTVKNSTFTNNKGINGGAIHGINAPLLIEDCTFTGNLTTDAFFDTGKQNDFLRGYGGAIYTDRATTDPSNVFGSIILRRCKFENNKGRSEGGAAYLYTGEKDNVLVENCNFNNNQVLGLSGASDSNSSDGGAITQMNASNTKNSGVLLTNSTFSNNTSINGGGAVRVRNADTKIQNCTFNKNSSTLIASNGYGSNGGAVALDHDGGISTVNEITNSTFAENSAGWVGGAIIGDASVKIKNNIFLNNTTHTFGNSGYSIALHTSNEMTDLGGNLQYPAQPHPGDSNDCNVSSSVTIANANLLPLSDNGGFAPTMALQAGSPAIDFGVDCTLPQDERGIARVGNCDAGAFEYAATLPVTIVNFTVKAESNRAKIEWTTASEINNSYFEILKSTDGVSFVTLNKIQSKASGTGLNQYLNYDYTPSNGINYYKLVQYDTDGKLTLIGIKPFELDLGTNDVMVYPNPTVDNLFVNLGNYSGKVVNASLLDLSGKIIFKSEIKIEIGKNIYQLKMTTKPASGNYILNLSGSGLSKSFKIIVL